jgi:hypothetical protein
VRTAQAQFITQNSGAETAENWQAGRYSKFAEYFKGYCQQKFKILNSDMTKRI